jgi:hypothetical protein
MNPAQEIGVKTPSILLPKQSIDLHKWAVIACDQFTSEPEYWEQVSKIVSDAPSTLHMILPEVFLDTPEEEARIQSTYDTMQNYLQTGIFRSLTDMIYVRRSFGDQTRRGLMIALDLEHYDYNKGAQTLIRATEGTILERLPPRIRIRNQAPLECPHILVLFDDPEDSVLGPLEDLTTSQDPVYDFDLMLGSGHLSGIALEKTSERQKVIQALQALIEPKTFAGKYGFAVHEHSPLLFAMGDGNHSLATAKSIWEKIKAEVGMDHPARYALVEIENVHDPALDFEPIHRLLFEIKGDLIKEMRKFWGHNLTVTPVADRDSLLHAVDTAGSTSHRIGLVAPEGLSLLEIKDPEDNLPVGTLQKFLDDFLENNGAEKIDYVHGETVLFDRGQARENAGFYVPAMDKSDLFKTVILDGALPRKTFSMGEAREKRFYLECRRIQTE